MLNNKKCGKYNVYLRNFQLNINLSLIQKNKTGTIINGKEAVIIAGIVALNDKENEVLKNEHQYIITGCDIYPSFEKDLTAELKGVSIDGALTNPIWRL